MVQKGLSRWEIFKRSIGILGFLIELGAICAVLTEEYLGALVIGFLGLSFCIFGITLIQNRYSKEAAIIGIILSCFIIPISLYWVITG